MKSKIKISMHQKLQSGRYINFPFAPNRWPFFYGWVIVAMATLGTIASIPGQTIGVGVFTDSLIKVLERSRTELTIAYMLGTIASSMLLPWVGSLIDRLGVRVMAVISSLGLGISLFIFSYADLIPKISSAALPAIAMLALLFMLIRFFGQGCLTMVSRIALARWFNHRRGMATGIANVIVAYAFNCSPALLNTMVNSKGWKSSYILLAGAVGIGMTVIGAIFFRDNPKQCSLVMDGRNDPDWIAKKIAQLPQATKQFTRKQAISTSAFWIYTLTNAWQALVMTAVTFHMTSIGAEFNLSSEQSYAFFPYIGLVSVAAAVITGFLSDYIRLKWLIQASIICQILTPIGLMELSHQGTQILFITSYGISAGLFGLLLTIVAPRFFGHKHLGAISGLTASTLVFTSALGPILFSTLRDFTGTYRHVMILSVIIPGLLFIGSLGLKNPQSTIKD
jgi:MFS family permease